MADKLPTQEEARREWIDALRSGKYPQGKNFLHVQNRWCCLGVACDLFAARLGIKRRMVGPTEIFDEGAFEEIELLPRPIVRLLGLVDNQGSHHRDGVDSHTLISLNDDGLSFPEIADALETGDYWIENKGKNNG